MGNMHRRVARWTTVALAAMIGFVAPGVGPTPARADVAPGFHPSGPARLLDTRTLAAGPLLPGETRSVAVRSVAGLPTTAVAVVLNVTVTEPTESGFVTVWPTGQPQPATSNLNMVARQTVANLVVVGLGADGNVSFHNDRGRTQLIVDITGWLDDGFTPLAPERRVDTRTALGGGRLGPGGVLDVQVGGVGSIPTTAKVVALNVTATDPSATSYLTVWPTGEPRPVASNLNVVAGQTVPNAVLVALGDNGRVSVYNDAGSTDVIVDVMGWFSASVTGMSPARLLDTRDGSCGSVIPPGAVRTVAVAGHGGVPATGVGAVALNVTATEATGSTYLTVWPRGTTRPATSNLNLSAGMTAPNLVVVGLGEGGQVDVYNDSATVHLVVDVTAWFPGSTPSGAIVPCPPSQPVDVKTYLLRDGRLAIAHREIAGPAVLRGALTALFEGATATEGSAGLGSAVPSGTRLLGVSLADGLATVDLSGDFATGGGSLSMMARVAQVVFTATQFPNVDRVAFRMNGAPIEFLGGEGLVLTEPQARWMVDRSISGSVLVDSPLPGATVRSPFTVTGEGDVYEAEFPIEVWAGGRQIALVAPVRAGAWGVWAPFTATIAVDAPPGPIQLVAYDEGGCGTDPECPPIIKTIVPLTLAG